MSYLSKPGSNVAHIYDHCDRRTITVDGVEHRALWAMCPTPFIDPQLTGYFVERGRRRVCKHCAQAARRRALRLLNLAAGDDR